MLSQDDRDTQVHAKAKQRKQRTFTLVEQDRSTVATIGFWILQNIETAPAEKLHDALETAVQMRSFPSRRAAD